VDLLVFYNHNQHEYISTLHMVGHTQYPDSMQRWGTAVAATDHNFMISSRMKARPTTLYQRLKRGSDPAYIQVMMGCLGLMALINTLILMHWLP